jgi:hypothetical protein
VITSYDKNKKERSKGSCVHLKNQTRLIMAKRILRPVTKRKQFIFAVRFPLRLSQIMKIE